MTFNFPKPQTPLGFTATAESKVRHPLDMLGLYVEYTKLMFMLARIGWSDFILGQNFYSQ